jgi:hypothetical protein
MLRRLALSDMDSAARIHRIAFDQALPALTGLHTPEEVAAFSASASLPNASCGAPLARLA